MYHFVTRTSIQSSVNLATEAYFKQVSVEFGIRNNYNDSYFQFTKDYP